MYEELNNNTGSGSYYDTNGGYVHYDSQSQMKQPKKKKKGGFGRTIAKCTVLALVFGSVSSGAFMGTNYIGKQMFGDAVAVEGAEENKAGEGTPTTAVANNSSDVYVVYRSELYAVSGVHYQYGNDGVSDIFRHL